MRGSFYSLGHTAERSVIRHTAALSPERAVRGACRDKPLQSRARRLSINRHVTAPACRRRGSHTSAGASTFITQLPPKALTYEMGGKALGQLPSALDNSCCLAHGGLWNDSCILLSRD
ncbi:hypothetical protein MHYP_G00301370 [Metynnis hypsauchen]